MERSDQQLVIDYLKGDEGALEILIKCYLKPIFSFTYRYVGNYQEAEDITQDVFIKAWRNLKKFDQDKSFKTWIFSIAKNTSIDCLRKKKTLPLSDTLANKFVAFINPFKEPLLDAAMGKLSLRYRETLSLYYNDQFTFREIAEKLGESINTVKSRHRRGIFLLKKRLS